MGYLGENAISASVLRASLCKDCLSFNMALLTREASGRCSDMISVSMAERTPLQGQWEIQYTVILIKRVLH